MVNWPSHLSRIRECFKCVSSILGSAHAPELCVSEPLPASPLGLLVALHTWRVPHGLWVSAPCPPFLSLLFPLSTPLYLGAQGQGLFVSASSPRGPHSAPHPSPSLLHPCWRRPTKKTLSGPQEEDRMDSRFGFLCYGSPASLVLIQGPTLARTGPGEMVPCAGWVQHLSWTP